ncbi:MAG: PD-(D/E)XK nuclease family protein [Rickettsiales bacterium]|jgi:ATP-dependent helicase/nuclease subunit B|nr:PD-(D/E)XK nuclease family protein [Rickettsiales bacterium]
MNIYNIPLQFNFLQKISSFILTFDNIDKLTIFMPSRRSCNELKRILLLQSKNDVMFLPNIKAIGDIDYDDLLFNNVEQSTISRTKYKVLLVKRLLEWYNKTPFLKDLNIKQICDLAGEFEKFYNEALMNELSFDNLDNLVTDNFSEHWQRITVFLKIFGNDWAEYTKKNNIISKGEYIVKALKHNADFYRQNKPQNPIIIAGIATNIKSTNNFIQSLTKYDNCYFIFNGLDLEMEEKIWNDLDIYHPQGLFKNMLNIVNCKRMWVKDIKFNNLLNEINTPYTKDENITSVEVNTKILNYSILPSKYTYKWQDKLNIQQPNIIEVECENTMEEMEYIVSNINPNKTTAIITTNNVFAEQIEVILKNNGRKVYNVFGNKYAKEEFIKYLFLILDTIKNDFETISLLSLLKHKFTALNIDILKLEDDILRNFGGGGEVLRQKGFEWLLKIITLQQKGNFTAILEQHIELAEKIANFVTNDNVSVFLNDLVNDSVNYGDVKDLTEYSYLLDYLIAENSYTNEYEIHPAISIISPQETILLNYDMVFFANCNDEHFPQHIQGNPWMSKSMREKFGLPKQEEQIRKNAMDWCHILSNEEIVITRAIKENGTTTTKSKFLLRLETFLKCQPQIKINIIKYKKQYTIQPIQITKPKQQPPLKNRPNKLYATKIEKLINNPYDIYVEKVLGLNKKKDFNEDKDNVNFGSAVHEALEKYIKNGTDILDEGKKSFKKYFIDETKRELFFVRFEKIAKFFVKENEKIKEEGYNVIVEQSVGKIIEGVDIRAKIDRMEIKEKYVNIVDYKTGITPSKNKVINLEKPQLVIESIILKDRYTINKLVYWKIKGKSNKDEKIIEIKTEEDFVLDDLIAKGEEQLIRLISKYQCYDTCYVCTKYELNSGDKGWESDYKHLSRVEEWGYYNIK